MQIRNIFECCICRYSLYFFFWHCLGRKKRKNERPSHNCSAVRFLGAQLNFCVSRDTVEFSGVIHLKPMLSLFKISLVVFVLGKCLPSSADSSLKTVLRRDSKFRQVLLVATRYLFFIA